MRHQLIQKKILMNSKQIKIKTNNNKFFIYIILACIVLGIEYIHTNKIIHKDIKPENLLLSDKGYLKIIGF